MKYYSIIKIKKLGSNENVLTFICTNSQVQGQVPAGLKSSGYWFWCHNLKMFQFLGEYPPFYILLHQVF